MIPCLNEQATLPLVLGSIPNKIPGIDDLEILIIDDGCTDDTVEVARRHGVTQFVHHTKTQGLSKSFKDGINRSLELGADIIALTDGDNQYPQERLPDLIEPILEGKADVVIADRQTRTIDHFSRSKKFWQRLGTWVLNQAAGTDVPDAVSGFRAYSREAALELNPIANYSFATETTIQASHKRQAMVSIPVKTNPKLRESRQFKSSWEHVRKSSITIVRAFVMYRPYALFLTLGVFFLMLGALPFLKFLYELLTQKTQDVFGPHHLQSLIVGSVLLVAAFISFTLGVIADLIRINRLLLEDLLLMEKRRNFGPPWEKPASSISQRATRSRPAAALRMMAAPEDSDKP
jgi:glycosyltransferase involved in cell wall biosynthesis